MSGVRGAGRAFGSGSRRGWDARRPQPARLAAPGDRPSATTCARRRSPTATAGPGVETGSSNHSTPARRSGGAVSRTWTVDRPPVRRRRWSAHLAMAHLGPRHPPGARRAGLPAAGAPRAQPVDIGFAAGLERGRHRKFAVDAQRRRRPVDVAQPVTQRRVLGAVSCAALCAVSCAAAGGGSSAGRAAPPGGASARPAADPRHDRQGQMQMQAGVFETVWLRPMMPSPSQLARRKVQIRPVLMHSTVSWLRCSVRARWGRECSRA